MYCNRVFFLSLYSWFPPVLGSPGKPWNLKSVLESPGILLKFWKNPGIFLWLNKPKERFLSKHQHFSGFLCMLNLAVHWLTALIFIWGILDAIMSIYSHHWVTIFKITIKRLILELRNCLSNTSATVSVLFDSSPFGTC